MNKDTFAFTLIIIIIIIAYWNRSILTDNTILLIDLTKLL